MTKMGYDTSFTYGIEDSDKNYCTLWLFLEVEHFGTCEVIAKKQKSTVEFFPYVPCVESKTSILNKY